jgi:DNA-binding NarL/FixJ family response regulator
MHDHEHVLVVENDERFAVDMVGTVLELGFTASSAASASQAIELAQRSRPAVLVADLDLGGELGGVRLAETVTSRWGSAVILMTTRTDRETAAAIAEVESTDVLCRPFHWRQFEMTLRLALERRARAASTAAGPTLAVVPHETSRLEADLTLRRIAAELSRAGYGPPVPGISPHHEWLAAMRPREREVVKLLLQHQRVPAIARTLSIRPATVRNHLKNVFRRMGIHSQQELLLLLQQTPDQSGGSHRPSISEVPGPNGRADEDTD